MHSLLLSGRAPACGGDTSGPADRRRDGLARARFGFLGVLALGLSLQVAGGPVGADTTREGVILRRNFGIVELQRAGSGTWIRATDRIVARAGDTIRTGERSWSIVEVSPDNVVRLGARTLLVVKAARQFSSRSSGGVFSYARSGIMEFDLKEGIVMPVLSRLEARVFRVATPIAAIGVRGTTYLASVEKVGEVRDGGQEYNVDIEVYTGVVEITDLRDPDGGSFMLPEGQALRFRSIYVPSGGFGGSQGGGRPGGPGAPGAGPGAPGGRPGTLQRIEGGQRGQAGRPPAGGMPPPAMMGSAPPPNFQPPPS